jgi:hypothetical protein
MAQGFSTREWVTVALTGGAAFAVSALMFGYAVPDDAWPAARRAC